MIGGATLLTMHLIGSGLPASVFVQAPPPDASAEPSDAARSGAEPDPAGAPEDAVDPEGETVDHEDAAPSEPSVDESASPEGIDAEVDDAPPGQGASTWGVPSTGRRAPSGRIYDPASGIPPGGYWDPGEAPESAPPDGEDQRIAGLIVLPLGTLTAASGAAMLYFTEPGHCIERTAKLGYNLDEDQCRGLLVVNAIRVAYGALGMITGAVLIGVGYARKKRLEEWKRRRFRAALGPGPGRGRSLSAQVTIRF